MNVKPGDLAIQINSIRGKTVGSIVEVISGWGLWDGEYYWNIRYAKDVSAEKNGFSLIKKAGELVQCKDLWLRPISGLLDNNDMEDEKPIKEIA